jgi:hypothetical protein
MGQKGPFVHIPLSVSLFAEFLFSLSHLFFSRPFLLLLLPRDTMAQNKLAKDLETALDAVNLEPLAPTLTPLMDEALAETNQASYRRGTFLRPKVLLWLVLALTIRRDLNYHAVLNWMLSTWRWLTLAWPAQLLQDGAISHARVKLGVRVLVVLFQKVVLLFTAIEADFHGLVTVIFDGTTLRMPDTVSNRDHFGKHRAGRGDSGFPLMRVMALMVRAGRFIVDVALAPIAGKGTGERTLMQQILQRLPLQNALLLFDAGFYSFILVHHLYQKHHHFLMKISPSIKRTVVPDGLLPDGSYLALIQGKIEEGDAPPGRRKRYRHLQYLVRVIDVHLPGFRPFRLITSLLDTSLSAVEIARHYHQRWDLEIGYDEIKTHQCATLRGQAPTPLRSKRADLIQQELYALLIVYNLTRWVMFQAAHEQGGDPLQLSFLDTLHWIVEAVGQMGPSTPQQRIAQQRYLHRLIVQSTIDRPRRSRINPRVIKIKSSKFKVKRKAHQSQRIDYEQELQILPPSQIESRHDKAA